MDAKGAIIMNTYWFPHEKKPEYKEGADNRLLSCARLEDGTINMCYLDLRPDSSVNSCSDCHHNEKWLKKNATKWENLICSYWTYVRLATPLAIF